MSDQKNPVNGVSRPEGDAGQPVPMEVEQDLSQAAAEGRTNYLPAAQKWKTPNTMLILVGVILAILAFGAYGIVWMRDLQVSNDNIRLKTLLRRQNEAEAQAQFFKEKGYLPAGKDAKPLTAAERQELETLRVKYGGIPTGAAETQPATPAEPEKESP